MAQAREGRVIEPEDPVLEVTMLSKTRLMIPDQGVRDVVFGADGTVTRLVTVDVDRDAFGRVE